MTITCHPTLPFVEIGTEKDFGLRNDQRQLDDWFGSTTLWTYAIDGHVAQLLCESAQSAQEAAEEELFVRNASLLDCKASELRASGQIDLLLTFMELKGFWRGKADMRSRTVEALKPVMDVIGGR